MDEDKDNMDTSISGPDTPRPIEDLIKLDTYQGMTDIEIDMVMAYRSAIAAKDAVFAEQMDAQRELNAQIAQAHRDRAAHADAVLDALVAAELPMEVVAYDAPEE